ncbi:MAG: hypothetical protein ACOC32_00375 [Nanoarchaeota archaeon]
MEVSLNNTERDLFISRISKFPNLKRILLKRLPKELKKYYSADEFSIFSIAISDQKYWSDFLERLNELVVKNELYSEKRIRVKLFDNVFTFLTELEFGNYLIKANISPETDVKYFRAKDIDYKLPSNLYIEITTPRINQTDRETWLKEATAVPITFGVDQTIISKIEKQDMLSAIKNGFTEPIILLINGDYRGIDEIAIEACRDKLEKEHHDEFSAISGILLKRFENYIFTPNNWAKNRLTEDNLKLLKRLGIFYNRYTKVHK